MTDLPAEERRAGLMVTLVKTRTEGMAGKLDRDIREDARLASQAEECVISYCDALRLMREEGREVAAPALSAAWQRLARANHDIAIGYTAS